MSDGMISLLLAYLIIGNFKIRTKKFEFKFEGILYKIIASLL